MKYGYARVSSLLQAEDTCALEQQIDRLKQAGAVEVLVDVESGSSNKRKEFLRLEKLIESDRVSELIVTRVDRLGRSVVTIQRIVALLKKHSVTLRILDAPIDSTSSFGWFALSQMADLAQFETMLLSERVRHGMKYFREQGKASSKVPFGYQRIDEKFVASTKLHPNGSTLWKVAQEFVEIYLSSGSLRDSISKIWHQYEVKWSVAGFRDWLLNPALRGHTVYHRWHNKNNPELWDVRHNTHEALLDDDLYDAIMLRLKKGRLKWGKNAQSCTAAHYPLAGQVKCGECGGNYYRYFSKKSKVAVPKKPKPAAMRCRKHDEGKHLCSATKSIRHQLIEEAVILALIDRKNDIISLCGVEKKEEEPEYLVKLKQQLAGLLSLGSNPAFNPAIADLKLQIHQAQIENSKPTSAYNWKLINSVGDQEFFLSIPEEKRITLYEQLVESVVIKDGEVKEVNLNF